jgi:hypothetical protein
VTEEIMEEIKKRLLESNKNKYTTYHHLWDIAKSMLRGNFIVISAYMKKTEASQINN